MSIQKENNGSKNQFQSRSDSIWKIFNNVPKPSEDLEERIIVDATRGHDSTDRRSTTFTWVYRLAAMVILLLGAGILFFYTTRDDVPHITHYEYTPILYSTQRGETGEFYLTDYIYVQLNAESELRVSAVQVERAPTLVFLQGEAYFRVSKAPYGFQVTTDAGIVEVVGTSFNVRARGNEVEVAVESGLVALRGLEDEESDTVVQIPAGFKSVKQRSTPALEPLPVDLEKYLSWRQGRFVFEQTPIVDVIRNLERAYNVRIELRGQNIETIRVTGEFGREPLTQILNEICWSANLRYRQEDDKFILYQPD